MNKCLCCNNEGTSQILLAEGSNDDVFEEPRWYIPNQTVREYGVEFIKEVWFCHPCMRAIEDSLRATIMYLEREGGCKFQREVER